MGLKYNFFKTFFSLSRCSLSHWSLSLSAGGSLSRAGGSLSRLLPRRRLQSVVGFSLRSSNPYLSLSLSRRFLTAVKRNQISLAAVKRNQISLAAVKRNQISLAAVKRNPIDVRNDAKKLRKTETNCGTFSMFFGRRGPPPSTKTAQNPSPKSVNPFASSPTTGDAVKHREAAKESNKK